MEGRRCLLWTLEWSVLYMRGWSRLNSYVGRDVGFKLVRMREVKQEG